MLEWFETHSEEAACIAEAIRTNPTRNPMSLVGDLGPEVHRWSFSDGLAIHHYPYRHPEKTGYDLWKAVCGESALLYTGIGYGYYQPSHPIWYRTEEGHLFFVDVFVNGNYYGEESNRCLYFLIQRQHQHQKTRIGETLIAKTTAPAGVCLMGPPEVCSEAVFTVADVPGHLLITRISDVLAAARPVPEILGGTVDSKRFRLEDNHANVPNVESFNFAMFAAPPFSTLYSSPVLVTDCDPAGERGGLSLGFLHLHNVEDAKVLRKTVVAWEPSGDVEDVVVTTVEAAISGQLPLPSSDPNAADIHGPLFVTHYNQSLVQKGEPSLSPGLAFSEDRAGRRVYICSAEGEKWVVDMSSVRRFANFIEKSPEASFGAFIQHVPGVGFYVMFTFGDDDGYEDVFTSAWQLKPRDDPIELHSE